MNKPNRGTLKPVSNEHRILLPVKAEIVEPKTSKAKTKAAVPVLKSETNAEDTPAPLLTNDTKE